MQVILYDMFLKDYQKLKDNLYLGEETLKEHPFIHCSTIELFKYVAPRFKDVDEEMILLLIDYEKVKDIVKYEEYKDTKRYYPHIYGPIPKSAIIKTLPYLKDKDGNWIMNEDLKDYFLPKNDK